MMDISRVPVITPTCSYQDTPETPLTPPLYVNRSINNNEKIELKRSSSINTSIDEGECVGKLTPPKQLGIYLNPDNNSWVVSWEINGIYSSRSFPIDNTAPNTAHWDALRFYSHIIFSPNQNVNAKPARSLLVDNINDLNKINNIGNLNINKFPHVIPNDNVLLINKSHELSNVNSLTNSNIVKNSIHHMIPQTNGIFTRSNNNYTKQRKLLIPNDEIIEEKDVNRARGVYFDKNSQRWFGEHRLHGGKCAQSFSVKKYGYEEAHRLAVEWKQSKERESLVHDLGFPKTKGNYQYSNELREYYIKHSKLFPKVRGVWFNSTPHRMGWVGQAYKKCKRIEKIFSVSKHGFERARELAVNFRNSQKPGDKKSKDMDDVIDDKSDIYTNSPKYREKIEIERLATSLQSSPVKYNSKDFMRMNSIETHVPESPEPEFDKADDIENMDTWNKFDNLSIDKIHYNTRNNKSVNVNNERQLNSKVKKQQMIQFFDNFLNDIESILRLQLPFPNLPPLHNCFESLQMHRKKLYNFDDDTFNEYTKLLGHYYEGYIMPSDLPVAELYALISLITRKSQVDTSNSSITGTNSTNNTIGDPLEVLQSLIKV